MVQQSAPPNSAASQSSEEVFEVISKAAYLNFFSVPDPSDISEGTPLLPFISTLIFQIRIVESGRRLQLTVEPPTADCGFRSQKKVSQRAVSTNELTMKVIPNNFEPNFYEGPGQDPPPTLLLPFAPPRVMLVGGKFDFLDTHGTGFRAQGTGRFYAAPGAPGGTSLFIAGAAQIIEGLGQLHGLAGTIAINGYTQPPSNFANNFLVRFEDPDDKLTPDTPMPPIDQTLQNPAPEAVFISLMAERHPDHPFQIESGPNGKKQVRIVERLRLVDSLFDVTNYRIESQSVQGEIVGEHRLTLVFDPDDENEVIPVYSVESEFAFFTHDSGKPIGTLKANFDEGRAFRALSPQLHHPYFRLVGYGPFLEGTEQFKDLVGVLSVNGALSLTPNALSAMYIIRILDPVGRFQPAWSEEEETSVVSQNA